MGQISREHSINRNTLCLQSELKQYISVKFTDNGRKDSENCPQKEKERKTIFWDAETHSNRKETYSCSWLRNTTKHISRCKSIRLGLRKTHWFIKEENGTYKQKAFHRKLWQWDFLPTREKWGIQTNWTGTFIQGSLKCPHVWWTWEIFVRKFSSPKFPYKDLVLILAFDFGSWILAHFFSLK